MSRAVILALQSRSALTGLRRLGLRPLTRSFAAPSTKSKPAKGATPAPAGNLRTEQGLSDLYARCLEPKPTPIDPISDAEKAYARSIADTFVKLMFKRHHVQQRDLQRKLKLKWAAIYALPTPELRREALVINPFAPLWTRVPTETPPHKGFHAVQHCIVGAELDDEDAAKKAAAEAAAATLDKSASAALRSAAAFGALGSAARSRTGRSDSGVSLFKSGLGAPPPPAPASAKAALPPPDAKGKKKK